jgi:hypothetical protein
MKPRTAANSMDAGTHSKKLCQLEDRKSFQDLFEEFARETLRLMVERFDSRDKTRDNNLESSKNK